jgi:hypothetical protein
MEVIMAIITYPLNGIEYTAENAETYFCTRTSGVFSAEDNFALDIVSSSQVSIGKGLAWIKDGEFSGKSVFNGEDVVLEIGIADGTLNRKDRVVLKFDKSVNGTSIVLKEGTPATEAQAPAIVRNGTVYELGLYVIDVPAGNVGLQMKNIHSTMLDESVCGLMRDGVTGIPTEQLYKQAESIIENLDEALQETLAGNIPPHALTHAKGANDEITPAMIGADPSGTATNAVSLHNEDNSAHNVLFAKKVDKPTVVNGTGAITVAVAENTEYIYTSVTRLTMTGNTNEAHGFVTFGSSTPSVSVTGFAKSGGDDVAEAKASEIWEFSCDNGYIIWKNWSA